MIQNIYIFYLFLFNSLLTKIKKKKKNNHSYNICNCVMTRFTFFLICNFLGEKCRQFEWNLIKKYFENDRINFRNLIRFYFKIICTPDYLTILKCFVFLFSLLYFVSRISMKLVPSKAFFIGWKKKYFYNSFDILYLLSYNTNSFSVICMTYSRKFISLLKNTVSASLISVIIYWTG